MVGEALGNGETTSRDRESPIAAKAWRRRHRLRGPILSFRLRQSPRFTSEEIYAITALATPTFYDQRIP